MKDRSLLDSDQEHQDKSLLGGQNPSGFSKELQELINAVAEEVVLQGTSFDSQKTLLKRTAEAEGVDYGNLEKSLKDFFKAMGDYESKGDKSFMDKASSLAKDCGFSEDFIDKLIVALDHKRSEAQSLAEKEALEKEKERLAAEKAKQEAARKAAEEKQKKLEAKLKKAEAKAKADAQAAEEALKREKAKLASERAERERQKRSSRRLLVLFVVLLAIAAGVWLIFRSCGRSKESDVATAQVGGEWFHYDDGTYVKSIGTFQKIGIIIPADSIRYSTLSKVMVYDKEVANCMISVYNSRTKYEPSDLLGEMSVTLNGSNEYVEFEFATPVSIDPKKNVWIVLSYDGKGGYVPCAGEVENSDCRRLLTDDGQWSYFIDIKNAWMIRAYFGTDEIGNTIASRESQTQSPVMETSKAEEPVTEKSADTKPQAAKPTHPSTISWNGAATYSGPSQGGQPNGIGGTLTFTRDYQLDMKDGRGTMLEIKADETIENTKFDNGKLRQGELHRKDGTRKWFSI